MARRSRVAPGLRRYRASDEGVKGIAPGRRPASRRTSMRQRNDESPFIRISSPSHTHHVACCHRPSHQEETVRARHAVSLCWVFGLLAAGPLAHPATAEIDGIRRYDLAASKKPLSRANVRPARAAAAGSCPPGRVDHRRSVWASAAGEPSGDLVPFIPPEPRAGSRPLARSRWRPHPTSAAGIPRRRRPGSSPGRTRGPRRSRAAVGG